MKKFAVLSTVVLLTIVTLVRAEVTEPQATAAYNAAVANKTSADESWEEAEMVEGGATNYGEFLMMKYETLSWMMAAEDRILFNVAMTAAWNKITSGHNARIAGCASYNLGDNKMSTGSNSYSLEDYEDARNDYNAAATYFSLADASFIVGLGEYTASGGYLDAASAIIAPYEE